jgi:hypothetical protein
MKTSLSWNRCAGALKTGIISDVEKRGCADPCINVYIHILKYEKAIVP